MQQKLIVMTGASGTGKTTLLTKLVKRYGDGRVLTITTRPRRAGEATDAYHFVHQAELDAMEARQETIWIVSIHGNQYSVTGPGILQAISQSNGVGFIAISPDRHAYLAEWCTQNSISSTHVHLIAPDRPELERRLRARDGEKFDPSRLDDTSWFEREAAKACQQTPLHFIEQRTPEEMFAEVCSLLDNHALS